MRIIGEKGSKENGKNRKKHKTKRSQRRRGSVVMYNSNSLKSETNKYQNRKFSASSSSFEYFFEVNISECCVQNN